MFEVRCSVYDLASSRLRALQSNIKVLTSDIQLLCASREGLAPTPCKHIISGTISLRSQRFFSPFPRGTCSLSVANEYLGLRGGPRRFIRSFMCIVFLRKSLGVLRFSVTGLSPSRSEERRVGKACE